MSHIKDVVRRAKIQFALSRTGKTASNAKVWFSARIHRLSEAARRANLGFRRLLWDELDPVVRGTVLCLLVLGSVLSVGGGIMDVFQKWNDFPFLVNMVSSAAAACFGVPIALVLIQYLLRQQDDHTGRIRLRKLAQEEASKIVDSARHLGGDLVQMQSIRARLQFFEHQLRRAQVQIGFGVSREKLDAPGKSDTFRNELREIGSQLQKSFDELRDLIPEQRARRRNAAQLASSWRYLDDPLRRRAGDVGVHWIEPDVLPPGEWDPWQGMDSVYGRWHAVEELQHLDHSSSPNLDRRFATTLEAVRPLLIMTAQAEKLLEFAHTVEDQLRSLSQDSDRQSI